MAREDTPLDQAVFDATLAAELAKGSDRRVADGRARSAAVRAYKAAHPEEEAAAPAAARSLRLDPWALAPQLSKPACSDA
jgi:hypothetical protein